MRSTLAVLLILALAMALSACSDSTGPGRDPVAPSDLRLAIVSGGHQSGPAGGLAASPTLNATGLVVNELPAGLLPEPLVARIVDTSGGAVPLSAIAAQTIVVTYRVIQPDGYRAGDRRHCGASFIDSQAPDSDGLVTTYWEAPTIADHECRMEARLVVDGVPRVDTVFTAVMEPGPVRILDAPGRLPHVAWVGDTIDLSALAYAHDQYGNPWPQDSIQWTYSDPLYPVTEERWDTLVASIQDHELMVPIASFEDIGEGWVYSYGCGEGRETPSAPYIDSLTFTLTIDSLTHTSLWGTLDGYPLQGEIYGKLETVRYLPGEPEPHVTGWESARIFYHRQPGEILAGGPLDVSPLYSLVRDEAGEYVGGHRCQDTATIYHYLTPPVDD